MTAEEILNTLSNKEKIALCSGKDYWHTKAMPKRGIPAVKMADGPNGLRCQADGVGIVGVHDSLPATCFPAAVTAGATWDAALYEKEGAAIAEEAAGMGVSILLGPGCNIKRNPRGGRNFEYLSEDPLLSGKMAAAFIRGVEKMGISACVKHFAVNSQEYKRQNGDSLVDERTLRELYLSSFELAVKEGKPSTVMCSYNKINGTHASDHGELLTEILRREWGFDGAVITDWGAMNDRIDAFSAGCDLSMPGGSHYMERAARRALEKGLLAQEAVDRSAERVLRLTLKEKPMAEAVDLEAHSFLARKIAEEGAVLLKNEGGILPLVEQDCALFGYMAEHFRFQGSGSSHINAAKTPSLAAAMPHAALLACGDENGNVSEEEIAAAVALAKRKRTAVVVVGLPELYESEGFDREHLSLPMGHNRLVEAVAEANARTAVVLLGGGVMELPWADRVQAILYMGLAGQEGDVAAANLLTGRANPCGKLTESWPFAYSDVISRETFGQKDTEYREGLYVGYRYYGTAGVGVRYPFGHGLSYTKFTYSNLSVAGNRVSFTVKNEGDLPGAEVAEVYVSPPAGGPYRPQCVLGGFEKVRLAPGEETLVELVLSERAFSLWQDGWRIQGGVYTVKVGASAVDIRLFTDFTVEGECLQMPLWQKKSFYNGACGVPAREEWEALMGHPVPPPSVVGKGQFTMDNTVLEMKDHSFSMRVIYRVAKRLLAKNYGKDAERDPSYRMVFYSALDGPLRLLVMGGQGLMPEGLARGLLHMANGRFFRGIFAMLRRYR